MWIQNGLVLLGVFICFEQISCKKNGSNERLSPCPSKTIIQKTMINGPPGKRNTWDGIILLRQWPNYSGFTIRIEFNRSGKFQLSNNDNRGRVETVDGRTYLLKYSTSSHAINEIYFQMKGKPNEEFPNISGIYLNDVDICNKNVIPTIQPQQTNYVTTEKIVPTRLSNYECGTRKVFHEGLITHGYSSKKGDWPWHTALFLRKSQNTFSYICGGSLISTKTIITAAHCVCEDGHVVIPSRIFVKLGLYNRLLSDENTQEFQVYQIYMHNEFNTNSYQHDITLLKLSNEVRLTPYVLPICLWPDNNLDIDDLVGKKAFGVGWGFNENDELSDILSQAEIPVVSFATCLESNRDFFGTFLLENNFCAGFRNGTNVCNGDSGGGLVLQFNGVFYLRGIVSVAAVKKNKAVCNPQEYVLFTDAAKYKDWINSKYYV